MQRNQASRKVKRELTATRIGEKLTADHIIAKGDNSRAASGEKVALAIRDMATGFMDCIPAGEKDATATFESLRMFLGRTRLHSIYTDNAGGLTVAALMPNAVHETSTPYRPQSNSLAERLVKTCVEGTLTIL